MLKEINGILTAIGSQNGDYKLVENGGRTYIYKTGHRICAHLKPV